MSPFEQFLATRVLSDHPVTQEQYGRILRRFGERCLECDQPWEKADAEWLDVYTQQRAWARHSRGGLYAANTLDQERRVLRHFYRWAFGEGLIAVNPTQHWVLPRPVQPDRNLLTRLQVQQLLNLPDLTTPIGQRDQLLMEMLYGPSLAVSRLHLFTTDWNPDWEPIRATWEAYLRDGRRRLLTAPSDKLFLSKFGCPMTSPITLRLRLKAYGKRVGVAMDLRSLQRAFKYHNEELARRHAQVPRPGS